MKECPDRSVRAFLHAVVEFGLNARWPQLRALAS
jgi:hypothetical protein